MAFRGLIGGWGWGGKRKRDRWGEKRKEWKTRKIFLQRPKSYRGEEKRRRFVIVLQLGLNNAMRLLTCYNSVDWGNKETLTREALSWNTDRAKISESHILLNKNVYSSCLRSFTLYPVLPHIWTAEKDQRMTDRMRHRRTDKYVSHALRWADGTKIGKRLDMEPPNGGRPV